MSDNYCDNCKKRVPIWIRYRTKAIKYAPPMTTYEEVYAICQFCGKEVYDHDVEDMNIRRRSFATAAIPHYSND